MLCRRPAAQGTQRLPSAKNVGSWSSSSSSVIAVVTSGRGSSNSSSSRRHVILDFQSRLVGWGNVHVP